MSTFLQITEMSATQGNKYLTHNNANRKLRILGMPVIKSRSQSSAPAGPSTGDCYIIPVASSSKWGSVKKALSLTFYDNGAWTGITPTSGWEVYVVTESQTRRYNGSTWLPMHGKLKFFTNDSVVGNSSSFNLPTIVRMGHGLVTVGTSTGRTARSMFFVDNDGDVTLSGSSLVVANTCTAGNLSLGTSAAQAPVKVKNKIGASKRIILSMWYD